MNFLVSGLFSTADSYGSGTATVEIIIMLLVAFILGYLLRYFLSKSNSGNLWKDKYDNLSHQHSLLEERFSIYENENRKLVKAAEKCKENEKLGFASIEKTKNEPAKKDSLRKIEGIGPKIEQMLYTEGIYTWDALSKTEVAFIQTVLDKGGPAYKVHNPGSWPFQAGLAATGKWDELKKWQDEHKHGLF